MGEEKMRAVRIVSQEGGGELEVVEVERPVARAARVRVRVRGGGVNRAALLQKRGRYPAPRGAPADIPGLEFAGEVEQVGEDVRAWRVGQRVFGITAGGARAGGVGGPGRDPRGGSPRRPLARGPARPADVFPPPDR